MACTNALAGAGSCCTMLKYSAPRHALPICLAYVLPALLMLAMILANCSAVNVTFSCDMMVP